MATGRTPTTAALPPHRGRPARLARTLRAVPAVLLSGALLVLATAVASAASPPPRVPAIARPAIGHRAVPRPATAGAAPADGYDLVGADGGVFVFPSGQSGGFYGSLPGIGVHVDDIVGMVPSANDQGYFLVGRDGGVFSFGDTYFEGSLPGIGVHTSSIVGIIPSSDDKGYFLVGSDGGVFVFGDANFEGSLPGDGVQVNDVVGIAATADNGGYWVVTATGVTYSFGDAGAYAPLPQPLTAPIVAIAATADGQGLFLLQADGTMWFGGEAADDDFGDLPSTGVHIDNVTALVLTDDDHGYWMVGSDGGIFTFGDATYQGSLPGIAVGVDDIVGAVPTVAS
jgi:hypothetical protein